MNKFVRNNTDNVLNFFAKKTILLCILFCCIFSAWTANYTWTGGGGADTNWTNTANWGGSGYPGQNNNAGNDTATFKGNVAVSVTIDTNITISTLITNLNNAVFGSGGGIEKTFITIEENKSLTVTDETILGGPGRFGGGETAGKLEIIGPGSFITDKIYTRNDQLASLTVSNNATVVVKTNDTDDHDASKIQVEGETGTVIVPEGNIVTGSVTTVVSGTITWFGSTDTAWDTATNWSSGTVPESGDSVVIPNTVNKPIITSAVDLGNGNITITKSSSLTVNNTANLTTTGVLSNEGTFTTTGGITSVGSLMGTGAWNLAGTIMSTDALGQSYEGAVTLGGDTTLSSGAGKVFFDKKVDGNNALIINASETSSNGLVTFEDPVGTTNALKSLSITANSIHIDTGSIKTNGNPGQEYNGEVVLGATVTKHTLTTNNNPVSFRSAINGNKSLEIDAGSSTVSFGGLTELTSLSVTSNTININGGAIITTGAQTYNGAVILGGTFASVDFTTTDDDIIFNSTLQGAKTANFTLGTGTLSFIDDVGTTTPALTKLDIKTANQIVFNKDFYASNLSFTDQDVNLVFSPTESTDQTIDVQETAFNNVTGTITKSSDSTTTFTNGFSQPTTGAGNVSLLGGVVATKNNLSFSGNTSLTGETILTTNDTAGLVALQGATGAQLTVDSSTILIHGVYSNVHIPSNSVITTTGSTTIDNLEIGGISTIMVKDSNDLTVTTTLRSDSSTSNLTVYKDSASTVTIPAGGALALSPVTSTPTIRFYELDESDNTTTNRFNPNAPTTGSPYKVAWAQNLEAELDITITVTGTTSYAQSFKYYVNSPFGTTETGTITFDTSGSNLSKSVTISGFTAEDEITLRTPCDSLVIGTYTKEPPSWTGAVDSNWHNIDNWQGISDLSQLVGFDIVLDEAYTNQPKITNAAATTVKSLLVENGAVLTIGDSADLIVTDILTIESLGTLRGTAGSITTNALETIASGTVVLNDAIDSATLTFTGVDASLTNATATNTFGNIVVDDTDVGFELFSSITATSFTANRAVSVRGSITTTGAQTYNSAVTLGGDTEFNAGTNGIIEFKELVTGEFHNLTISESKKTTFYNTISVIDTLSVTANEADSDAEIAFEGNVSVNTINYVGAKVRFNKADDTTEKTIDIANWPDTFSGELYINTTWHNNIHFTNTGEQELIAGKIYLRGNIDTSGSLIFDAPSALISNVTITAGANDITFADTLDSHGETNLNGLTITSANTVTFNEAVGTTQYLTKIDITANTINIDGGSVTTNEKPDKSSTTDEDESAVGTQAYNGNVFLGADTALKALKKNLSGNSLTFKGNISGAKVLTLEAESLIFDSASDQTVDISSSPLTFDGSVTKSKANTLTFEYGFSQTGTGTVSLRGDVTATTGNLSFTGSTSLNSNTALTASTGIITLAGAVTETASSTLNVTATTIHIDGESVTTTGNQTYDGAVVLRKVTALDSGTKNITFLNTVGGAYKLTTNNSGTTTFADAITDVTELTVTTDILVFNAKVPAVAENSVIKGPAVLKATSISFGNNENDSFKSTALSFTGSPTVELAGTLETTSTTTGASAITFPAAVTLVTESTVTTADGDVTFNDTVTQSTHTFTVNTGSGATAFNENITGSGDLTINEIAGTGTLAFIGGSESTGALTIRTSGNVTFGDENSDSISFGSLAWGGETPDVTLAGTLKTTTSTIEFPNEVTLAENSAVETITGDIIFENDIINTSSKNLIVKAIGEKAEFRGNIGKTTALKDFYIEATSILINNGDNGQETNATGTVTLITPTDSTGKISLGNHTDDKINFGSFAITTGTLNLGGKITTANGGQEYDCNIILTADTKISASTSTSSEDVTFSGTINSDTYDYWNLSIYGSSDTAEAGTVTFCGEVGTNTSLKKVGNLSVLATSIVIETDTITTIANQTYSGTVIIDTDKTLTARGTDATITFDNKVTGGYLLNLDADKSVFSSSDTTNVFSPIVFIGDSMALDFGQHNADIFMDLNPSAKMTLTGGLSSNNIYAYNGNLDLNGNNIETRQDFVIFGSNYDPKDYGWHESNTRFSYYHNTPLVYYPVGSGTHNGVTNTMGSTSASFTDFDGETISVGGNFYNNGADMEGASSWMLNIPANGSPTSNNGNAVTETQWGAPYAVAFNMTVQNSTATGGWVAAASDKEGQNVLDVGNNTNWQFESPLLETVHITTDKTLNLDFSTDIIIPTSYNDFVSYFSKAHTFTKIVEIASNSVTATAMADDSWNTDMNGKEAPISQSTNSLGEYRTTTNDVSLMKGAFYHENGNTMSKSSDYAVQVGATKTLSPSYIDRCSPVLIAAYTGQELHGDASSTPTNLKPYDSHNFLEFVYSEEVASTGVSRSDTNIKATDSFGKSIQNGNGVDFAGLASIANGKLDVGDEVSHAFYRNYSIDGESSEVDQTHRLRLSIVGYVDGEVTVAGKTHHNWKGFINEAITPSGTVTPISGYITDVSNNPVSEDFSVEVNSTVDNLYSSWDISPPVFAKFSATDTSWLSDTEYKEITSYYETTGFVEQLEFHFFDNTPTYTTSDEYIWHSIDIITGDSSTEKTRGWFDTSISTNSITDSWNDTHGGSRFVESATIKRTSGGIRASTLYNVENSLSVEADGNNVPLELNTFDQFVRNKTIFSTKGKDSVLIGGIDTPYLSISLFNDDQYKPHQEFSVSYDATVGAITDLAGNKMRSSSDNRTIHIPHIVFTMAPIGSNEVYLQFSAPMDTSTESLRSLPINLQIANLTSGIQVDETVPARVVADNENGTGFIIELNQDITYADITEPSGLTGSSSPTIKDVLEVKEPQTVPEQDRGIKREDGKLFAMQQYFPLSIFAINAVDVLYAYDNRDMADVNDGFIGDNIFGTEMTARVFDGSGAARNTILAGEDIELAFAPIGGFESSTDKLSLKLGVNPTVGSQSVVFNKFTGYNSRVWLPVGIGNLSNLANENDVKTVGPFNNDQGSVSIPIDSEYGWKDGEQFQFLFELEGKTIDHDNKIETVPVPLYVLDLKDKNDVLSIDFWSLNISDIATQRGGVTILNNVINTNIREKVRLEVNMPTDGSLTIHVMTIDGVIVKTLERGRIDEGLHYYHWDGTNNAGNTVARGLYFIRVVGPGIDETRKVMAVRD